MWSKVLLFVILFVAGCVILGARADAQTEPRTCCERPVPRPSRSYAVTLEDARGRPLRMFSHRERRYVLGQMGARYGIRVHNHTSHRVEAVVSVDGRDAISGRVAEYVHSRGYVVAAHGSTLIRGFRQSLDRVASFRFTDHSDSYSARLGTPRNVGVVGVAFFPEREWRRRDWRRIEPADESGGEPRPRRQARPIPRADGERAPGRAGSGRSATRPLPSRQRLGTQYGESRYSPVGETPFERAHRTVPDRIVRLYYDDAAGLEARGIEVYPTPRWPERPGPDPQPFPRRFAQPPP
jgi:hypothetical protein